MRTEVSLEDVRSVIEGPLTNPRGFLGPHRITERGRDAVAVRAYLPEAREAWLTHPRLAEPRVMRRIHPRGLFEVICRAEELAAVPYQIRMSDQKGITRQVHDPYAFDSYLGEQDYYLFGEGNHWRIYERLGAHLRTEGGVTGVNFAVWAPNAYSVSVVGDFNGWDGRTHAMQKRVPAGIWEIFIPGATVGQNYKFRVTFPWGESVDKCDPFGFAAEVPPQNASVVADLGQYSWNDDAWLAKRREASFMERPVNVYEVHLGSWKKDWTKNHGWRNYRDLAPELVQYCHEMGFTHIELMPISEHPYTGSWGYQTVGYYAVTSRYGSPEDFMAFVDYCHQHDIGVIIDWVPAHFPRDAHGLRQFDGTALYEHADPRQGEHPDWGTMIFNYGRTEVKNFVVANALFWLDKYHIDGLRVDAVASMLYLDYSRKEGEWVPNQYGGRENLDSIELLKTFNTQAHSQFPGVLTIAEESTSWPGITRPVHEGGLGFSLKWNMGWMNDTLRYMRRDPIHREHHHDELTFSMVYAMSENFMLPFSHDEVVHGKGALLDQMPGDPWQRFANLRLMYSYMYMHPGKKLLFMGDELGMWNEWNHDREIDWMLLDFPTHRGVKKLVADLNHLVIREKALHEIDHSYEGFEWIDCQSRSECVLGWMRKGRSPGDFLVVCANFTPIPRMAHRIGVPQPGGYREVFNSDSMHYDGTNVGNLGRLEAHHHGHHGRPFSLEFALPPLSVVVFKPES